MLRLSHLLLALCLSSAAVLSETAVAAESDDAILWTFDDQIPGELIGNGQMTSGSLHGPAYPDFAAENKVLQLEAPSWIRIADNPQETRFDFDNGDEITLETWVQINSIGENVYIVGKGRTGTTGVKAENQNWALRLRKNKGNACVNFLFRSRNTDEQKGNWHRWTSDTGIASGSRWHHVAVSYKFGEPKSIKGFIDGKPVKGTWDMGGATTQPPVVDDDDVWIGSTMAGLASNSLNGAIDNLAIHRRLVPDEELVSRYKWNPPPVVPPTIPSGKVVAQLFGPLNSLTELPLETDAPLTEWHQEEMGFVRLPHKYDSWGVREDWGSTMLVRAWTELQLPVGEYRLMVRSRGLSQLKIDGETVLSTPYQKNYSGAHHVVIDLPEVPVPGMRPSAMSDTEKILPFTSDGKRHRIQFDIIVGGPSYRLEFGETCVAVASPVGMFHILSEVSQYPLTDEGWLAFAERQSERMTVIDRQTRESANQNLAEYWHNRHAAAKDRLVHNETVTQIDSLITKRIDDFNTEASRHNATIAGDQTQASFFREHVLPIFDAHCTRCHGEKQQGELLITDRARLLKGGESGEAAVVPGDPENSHLFQLVSAAADDYRMPPKGDGLSDNEVQTLRTWISDGALMPAVTTQLIQQPELVDDHSFLRRIFIDTVGVPPTAREAEAFFAEDPASRRRALIDRLLKDPRWADNWVGYWQDVLAENPNLLKPTLNNTGPFRYWIHEALTDNKAIDRFATELILMRGSVWGGGAGGFSQASQNDVPMAAKAHVIGSAFLGVNMKCARCHDAPYHQWKQADLFQMAAMLDRRDLKLPATSTVPAAFFEKQERKSLIEVSLKAGADISAHFPFADLAPVIEESLLTRPTDTREQLAAQITASRRFAEVIANRVWKRLMGAGLVEPVDDWEGNPPSDPALLNELADTLVLVDYDLKEFTRRIFESSVYQRQAADLPLSGERHFAGPYRRRMSAEQIVDSAFHSVGQQMQTEMLTLDVEGTLPAATFLNFGFPQRSWEYSTLANERDRPSLALPRVQAVIDVLKAFGWRDSRPEPDTEREEAPNLIQPGVLANGTLGVWLTRLTDESRLTGLMLQKQSVDELIDLLFLQLLTRQPTDVERNEFVALLTPGFEQRVVSAAEIGTPHEERRFRYVSWSNHLNSEANIIKVQMQELVRQGPPPTRYLSEEWRERAEDAIWSLLNSPEMILIP